MDKLRMEKAVSADTKEIIELYQTQLYGPADWDEYYPSLETIAFDLSRDALFAMKNEQNEIVAVITIDSDENVETLQCWNRELQPSVELSRLCVREDMQNKGLARQIMTYMFGVIKKNGLKSVHILVREGHKAAIKSYTSIGYKIVGKCELYEKEFICMEKEL